MYICNTYSTSRSRDSHIYKGFLKRQHTPIIQSWMAMTIEAHGDEGIPHYSQASGDLGAGGLFSGSHIRWPMGRAAMDACLEHICFMVQDVHVCTFNKYICCFLLLHFLDCSSINMMGTFVTGRRLPGRALHQALGRCWHFHWSAHYAMGARDGVGPLEKLKSAWKIHRLRYNMTQYCI